MNFYNLNITISNDFGEIADERFTFNTLEQLDAFLTDETKMHKICSEAEDFAKENNMLIEEIFDSKEDAEFNKEDIN